eukprot:CAMPEP_0174282228 /NCGR_PEP_ID=MMETSP0809-20121228/2706_1 /TAXON_ID=73025 ORGANISM="Eutreptiella gymnastica-like, Strain CCMP1594" /NCGR_SAMPLE_ID=MMETSP0809 /ASSEMBLY_ACC=CAM_ASM_000658 /LENGTH=66 /DNA_ID=CAMNT_0015376283 /DNA_START=181 /DNA_END=381 /DNA_ORIENTATION=+
MAHATCRALPRALRRLVPRFSYFICANATIESLETHPVGAMPPGGGPITFPCLMNSEIGRIYRSGG